VSASDLEEFPMRRLLSVALFALASPALAGDTIADQAKAAYEVFAGGLSQQDFLAAHAGDKTFANVAGNWVRLNGPAPKTGIETYGADTEKFCKGAAAITLASPNPFVLTVTTNLKGPNFTQQYSLIAGTTFGEHTEPVPYLQALGLGPDKTGDQADAQRALLLSLTNGTVQIYRPSQDVLVIARERGYPIVLTRCPNTASEDAASPGAALPPAASSSEAK
jgi:hypothetical protein